VPIVTLTPITNAQDRITSATLQAAPTLTGFSATARSQTGTNYTTAAPTTYWIAVQATSTSGAS
jgi:hypothetical protein